MSEFDFLHPNIASHITWQTPKDLPNLDSVKTVFMDTETFCEDLTVRGVLPDDFVVGYAVATEDSAWYLPIEHKSDHPNSAPNMDRLKVELFIADLQRSKMNVWHNAAFDLRMLFNQGIDCYWQNNRCTMYAELILNEYASRQEGGGVSLAALLGKYCDGAKEEVEIVSYAKDAWGEKANAKANLWRMPPQIVAGYAMGDVLNLSKIYTKQLALLTEQGMHKEGVASCLDEEMELLFLLLDIERTGQRIDVARTRQIHDEMEEALLRIQVSVGLQDLNLYKTADLEALRIERGLPEPRKTAKSEQPQIDQYYLARHMPDVFKLKKLDKLRKDFIAGLLNKQVDGIVRPRFNSFGTRTSRFSCSNPNLQQVPKRTPDEADEELTDFIRMTREPFVGDNDDHCIITKDYSQKEPRHGIWLAATSKNMALQNSVKHLLSQYKEDPHTSVYDVLINATGLDKGTVKTVHLGKSYGLGKKNMAKKLKCTPERCEQILELYNHAFPHIEQSNKIASEWVKSHGFIRLWGAHPDARRVLHFPFWEPEQFIDYGNEERPKLSFEQAVERFPNMKLVPAFSYTAYNSLIQGSAAQRMKYVMRMIYRSGILGDDCRLKLTIHDECVFSANRQRALEINAELTRLMQTFPDDIVPFIAGTAIGESWGTAQELDL